MESKLIQVIEDDADLAMSLAIRLQAHGYRVVTSQDSITAVATARSLMPDLMILDLGLPGGSGLVFLGRLRSITQLALVPVIVLTAQGPAAEQQALQAGARAFFQKPVEHASLLAMVQQLLQPRVSAVG